MPERFPVVDDVPVEQYRSIFGTQVRVMTAADAVAELDERVGSRQPSRIAFLNANLANEIDGDELLQRSISSFLVFNDGIGLDIASLVLYGRKFPDNLVGTDFVPRYLTQTRHDLRMALLGGTGEVIRRAAEVVGQRWPQHEVAFWHHGYFEQGDEAAIAEAISRADCNITLVAMGNPWQELWISRNIPNACPMGVGVGALFDYLTGSLHRAPVLVRQWRLEWIYRLLAEPQRLWRRYLLGNPLFVARVIAEWNRRILLGRQHA
jgi:exopolysaccharide biosynthesis WecB/TagA/CpsF family protein